MSKVTYLTTQNFKVLKSKEGQVLCNSITGLSVVMFVASSGCNYSQNALEEFKQVSTRINGVTFSVLDITRFMDVVRMSRNTITCIEGVPYMMLYINGIPFQVFPDEYPFSFEYISKFVVDISTSLNKPPAKPAPSNGARNVSQQPKKDAPKQAKNGTVYYITSPLRRKNITWLSGQK